MDYEKRYKEANDKVAVRFGTNVAKEIFTDLYESEDERIRGAIIDIIKSQKEQQCHIDSTIYDEMIAWLEKQGEKKPVNEIDDDTVEVVKNRSVLDMASSQPHDYPEVFDKIYEKLCEIHGKMGDIYEAASKHPWWIYPYPQSPQPLDPFYKQEEWTVTCNNQNTSSNPSDNENSEMH